MSYVNVFKVYHMESIFFLPGIMADYFAAVDSAIVIATWCLVLVYSKIKNGTYFPILHPFFTLFNEFSSPGLAGRCVPSSINA